MKNSLTDFTENSLPLSRRKQFSFILNNEWKSLLLIGFLLFIFSIPYFATLVAKNLSISFYSNYFAAAGLTEKEIALRMIYINIIVDAVKIVCYIIFSIGLAGCYRVLRNIIYNNGLLFKDDFLQGIKEGYKPYIILSLIFGILKLVTNLSLNLALFVGDFALILFAVVAMVLFYIFIIPMLFYMAKLNSYYQMTFKNLFSGAARFALSTLFVNILFSLPLYFVQFLSLIEQLFIIIIIACIIVIVIVPLYLLAEHLFIISVFDKNINITTYPEIYRKGLSK